MKDDPPRIVIDMEDDYFCVNMPTLDIERIKYAPANIPDDAIIYSMKEFAGFSGNEREFDRMVLGVSKGLKLTGQVILAVNIETPFYIIFRYLPKEKHLFVQKLIGFDSQNNSIDLSTVDVSIKPEAPAKVMEQSGDMETELRKLKKLRDEGLINEEEYLKMKSRIIGQ